MMLIVVYLLIKVLVSWLDIVTRLPILSGMVVAGCIPLVILGVFVAMEALGIDLHKVSLGALIISLGFFSI